MCDQEILATMPRVNRRDFARLGVVASAGALAACASGEAVAQSDITERNVTFDAPGGQMDGLFIYPVEGEHPAVILWPDIAGVRDAKYAMGRELAREGYAVLVANPYYRSVAGEQFTDFDDFREQGGFQKVGPWIGANTPEAIAETAQAVVTWLDAQDEVDSSRGIGNQGYCMTGSWTIRCAAAVPDRIKAAASFHGGGLVGEEDNAPVNLLDDLAADAHVLIGIAQNDDANAPTDKDALAAAGEAAAATVTVEVYAGDHGWTVLDSPVYDLDEGDRAWSNLLALYQTAL